MPITELDPVTALIVVDLQCSMLDQKFLQPLEKVVARTRELLDAFRRAGLPVVLVNVSGRAPGRTEQGPRSGIVQSEGWTDLLPELDRQPNDLLVTKQSWGAFATTDLQAQLHAEAVTQVVLTGLVTSGGVEATARQAYELGFNVALALDAMTDLRADAENYSTERVFPRVGVRGTTQDIVALLRNRTGENA